jgi:predicted transcriptional regulator
LKSLLESLLDEKAPGPYLSFSIFHLIKALELIAKSSPIGRGKLSDELGTGEGAIRTVIERLRTADLIVVSKQGCFLTENGKKIWSKMQWLFPQKARLKPNKLAVAACNVAVRVRGCGDKVRSGLEQRDAALLAGAKGAAKDFPDAFRHITEKLQLEENDVIVIGSADTWDKAEYGALAAAWSLIDNSGVSRS